MEWLLLLILITLANITPAHNLMEYEFVKTLEVHAPAVSSSGVGVISKIVLAVAYPGSGRVFFSALPYTEVDTQGAARVAAFVASVIAQVDFSSYDYYVLVESPTPVIGGPSAGALFAVGFTSLLLDLPLNSTVTMTGMINPDGTIGPVGGLKEKLEAAASSGFRVFLIPSGQRIYRYPVYEEVEIGWVTIRRLTYRVLDLVEYGVELNTNVVEVSTVLDALYYFTGVNLSETVANLHVNLTAELVGILNDELSEVFNYITKYISEASNILSEVEADSHRNYYALLSRLNNTATSLLAISREHLAYALFKLIDLYEYALTTYLELATSTGRLSVKSILDSLEETLNEYSSEVFSTCTLESSLARTYLYLAWYYYSQAISTLTTSGVVEEVLSKIARSYRSLVEYKIYRNMSSLSSEEVNCTSHRLIHVYSNALASYVYAMRTLSEVGVVVSSSVSNLISDYVNVAITMSGKNDTGLLGVSALILAHTSLLLHQALGDITRVAELEKLLSIYYGEIRDIPVYALYVNLASSARSIGDVEVYYSALLYAVAVIEVFSQVHNAHTEISREKTPCSYTSITTPIESTASALSSSSLNSTPASSEPHYVKVYIDLLIVILAVIAVLVLLVKLMSKGTGILT